MPATENEILDPSALDAYSRIKLADTISELAKELKRVSNMGEMMMKEAMLITDRVKNRPKPQPQQQEQAK